LTVLSNVEKFIQFIVKGAWGNFSSFGFFRIGLCNGKNQMCKMCECHFSLVANGSLLNFGRVCRPVSLSPVDNET